METRGIESSDETPGSKELNGLNKGCSPQGVFLPIAILMVAVLLVMGWNLYLVKAQSSAWQKQLAQREQMVSQARAVQADLQRIASDLMTLAMTDPGAKIIVDKYQIKQDAAAGLKH